MKVRSVPWRHILELLLVTVACLSLPLGAMAQAGIVVQLEPMEGSGVSGTATLTAEGTGTAVKLNVQGLASGLTARVTMHALTCEMPSASFAAMPGLEADATGRAAATGYVLFHDMPLALTVMADGEHVIIVHADGQTLACGTIPMPTSDLSLLPATGGPVISALTIGIWMCGLSALSVALTMHLRTRRRL